MFCPKCGSILTVKEKSGVKGLACSCGYFDNAKTAGTIKESVRHSAHKVEVVGDEEKDILPKMKAVCPKCGHADAHYWLVQTRAGDEPETKFLRCENCRHTWRDYN